MASGNHGSGTPNPNNSVGHPIDTAFVEYCHSIDYTPFEGIDDFETIRRRFEATRNLRSPRLAGTPRRRIVHLEPDDDETINCYHDRLPFIQDHSYIDNGNTACYRIDGMVYYNDAARERLRFQLEMMQKEAAALGATNGGHNMQYLSNNSYHLPIQAFNNINNMEQNRVNGGHNDQRSSGSSQDGNPNQLQQPMGIFFSPSSDNKVQQSNTIGESPLSISAKGVEASNSAHLVHPVEHQANALTAPSNSEIGVQIPYLQSVGGHPSMSVPLLYSNPMMNQLPSSSSGQNHFANGPDFHPPPPQFALSNHMTPPLVNIPAYHLAGQMSPHFANQQLNNQAYQNQMPRQRQLPSHMIQQQHFNGPRGFHMPLNGGGFIANEFAYNQELMRCQPPNAMIDHRLMRPMPDMNRMAPPGHIFAQEQFQPSIAMMQCQPNPQIQSNFAPMMNQLQADCPPWIPQPNRLTMPNRKSSAQTRHRGPAVVLLPRNRTAVAAVSQQQNEGDLMPKPKVLAGKVKEVEGNDNVEIKGENKLESENVKNAEENEVKVEESIPAEIAEDGCTADVLSFSLTANTGETLNTVGENNKERDENAITGCISAPAECSDKSEGSGESMETASSLSVVSMSQQESQTSVPVEQVPLALNDCRVEDIEANVGDSTAVNVKPELPIPTESDQSMPTVNGQSDTMINSQPMPTVNGQEITEDHVQQLQAINGGCENHNVTRDPDNSVAQQSQAEVGKALYCSYCKNKPNVNNYPPHRIRDEETYITTCPALRAIVCEICGGTGDTAHTKFFCSRNPEGYSAQRRHGMQHERHMNGVGPRYHFRNRPSRPQYMDREHQPQPLRNSMSNGYVDHRTTISGRPRQPGRDNRRPFN